MSRRFRIKGKRVVDPQEVQRAKYLDAKRIGSRYVVTEKVLGLAPKTPSGEPKK